MLTRFAPSPTGHLHLGHALAAKHAFDFGPCLLRIEDIDHTRCKPEFTQAIYEDLAWLGFDWPQPVRIQSEHRADYDKVIDTLRDKGLLYRCFLTRKDLPSAPYQGPFTPMSEDEQHARIKTGDAFAWRLSLSKCQDFLGDGFTRLSYLEAGKVERADLTPHGDVVLARKDIGTSYHIAVIHDDAVQNISDVVRGQDLKDQTSVHVLLQTLMGWPTPHYHHHSLLMSNDGAKLSKRNQDTTIRSLREAGHSPQDVLAMACRGIFD